MNRVQMRALLACRLVVKEQRFDMVYTRDIILIRDFVARQSWSGFF